MGVRIKLTRVSFGQKIYILGNTKKKSYFGAIKKNNNPDVPGACFFVVV